jgi:hypothetical protein
MTACQHCGVDDALGRHDPVCPHAIDIGLPRLAEGEDPIAPEEENPLEESGYDGPVAGENDVSPNHPAHPQWQGAPRVSEAWPVVAEAAELWISYGGEGGDPGEEFDAVVFTSELEALRHAVTEGRRVHKLELGRSLREQVKS